MSTQGDSKSREFDKTITYGSLREAFGTSFSAYVIKLEELIPSTNAPGAIKLTIINIYFFSEYFLTFHKLFDTFCFHYLSVLIVFIVIL